MEKISSLNRALEEGRLIELPPSDKTQALKFLADTLEKAEGCCAGQEIFSHVMRREAQAITYLKYGIACPHARAPDGSDICCAIGWSPEGIDYGNTDGWPVHLILMFFVPDGMRNRYLTQLSALARAIEEDEALHELVNLKDLDEVAARIKEWLSSIEGRGDQSATPRQPTSSVLSKLLMTDIIEMLEDSRLNDIRIFLAAQPIPEIAELITALHAREQILIFRLLTRSTAHAVFALLDYPSQNVLLENMAQDETKQILAALTPDDRTALFEELPANVLQRLLNLLSDKDRKDALSLLSYPKDSVGRLMTNQYVAAREEWTVAQTLDHIRTSGSDSETLMMVYVVDDKGVLIDDILLRKLILASPQTLISTLTNQQYVALHSLEDREEAVKVFKKYDVYALPVVDSEGILLGVVTTDDILDVSEAEATEDFHKSMAIRPLSVGYLKTPLLVLYRSRILWLVILVFVNIFSGAGIAHFDHLISSFVVLVLFLPLLIDSGGNAGSQSATLVIRSMALGEITMRDFARAFWRESLVSVGLGLSMSAAVFLLAWWRGGILIALVVSLAMAAVVFIGSIIGLTLPFILRKCKLDPAVASSPLVTSLADVLGVLIYLAIASALLPIG